MNTALGDAVARLRAHADYLREGDFVPPPPYSMTSAEYQDDLAAVLAAVTA